MPHVSPLLRDVGFRSGQTFEPLTLRFHSPPGNNGKGATSRRSDQPQARYPSVGEDAPAAKRRKNAAHGASRGYPAKHRASPVGAKEKPYRIPTAGSRQPDAPRLASFARRGIPRDASRSLRRNNSRVWLASISANAPRSVPPPHHESDWHSLPNRCKKDAT